MTRTLCTTAACATLAIATAAYANNPVGSPPLGGDAAHVRVTVSDGSLIATLASPGLSPVTLSADDSAFEPPADVVNGAGFNAQYGWAVTGVWSLPPGGQLWIRVVDRSPGLRTYIGRPYYCYQQFDPCFGTDASSDGIRWDGMMLHNYYVTNVPGDHYAVYEVYLANAAGQPLDADAPGYVEPTLVELSFFADVRPLCPGDATGDSRANTADALVLLTNWGERTHRGTADGDFDGSGTVGTADLLILLAAWGTSC
jgi:hypothetical protein